MKIPKNPYPQTTKHIADKKFGFFFSKRCTLRRWAVELGLEPGTGRDVGFCDNPLTFLSGSSG